MDLDIKSFFDTIDHQLMMKAVAKHTQERWILLYIERWLKAPAMAEDGILVTRDRGTPQGGVISPLLANLFLHYAFDVWMQRNYPAVPFERYADDILLHCRSLQQAEAVKDAIARRLQDCKLELSQEKTRIVYCKDVDRPQNYSNTSVNFLGFTFRTPLNRARTGKLFPSFSPAISNKAAKKIRSTIRAWRLHLRGYTGLEKLAEEINPHIRGWLNYYGICNRSMMRYSLQRIDYYLVRWVQGKYKKLRTSQAKAGDWLRRIRFREPALFAHWQARFSYRG